MLLQGHYFTAENLVTIAQELDQRERAVLEDESQFQSQNYDDSGYFSIQVLSRLYSEINPLLTGNNRGAQTPSKSPSGAARKSNCL